MAAVFLVEHGEIVTCFFKTETAVDTIEGHTSSTGSASISLTAADSSLSIICVLMAPSFLYPLQVAHELFCLIDPSSIATQLSGGKRLIDF
jgi:hypothetical protein